MRRNIKGRVTKFDYLILRAVDVFGRFLTNTYTVVVDRTETKIARKYGGEFVVSCGKNGVIIA